MQTVEHCRAYWPVIESIALNPSDEAREKNPDIDSEIVLRAFCRSKGCSKHSEKGTEIFYTYPLLKGGKTGDMHKIKERDFEDIWFPRFAYDKKAESERQDRPRLKGLHSETIDNESVWATYWYLKKKIKRAAEMVQLPAGPNAAKQIYG